MQEKYQMVSLFACYTVSSIEMFYNLMRWEDYSLL